MIDATLDQSLQAIGLTLSPDARVILGITISACLGFLIGRKFSSIRAIRETTHLTAEHQLDQLKQDEQLDALSNTFAALSQKALQANNQSFLDLARETMARMQERVNRELEGKEKDIENLVKPIRDSLEKTDHHLRRIEQERSAAQGKLGEQLRHLMEAQHELQGETRNLVQALRRPEVRGQWGEMTLKRLVELAGMTAHCDFSEQVHTVTAEGIIRPDMVIHLPAGRELVVDVKTPLDAYLNAIEAKNDEKSREFLAQHARNVGQRIRELATKKYWEQFEQAPDFVVLFIPGEQFLSAALDVDRNLFEKAMKDRILLATPTSLIGILRAIAYGWSQQSLSENAEQIRNIGQDLHKRLSTLSAHLSQLGKNLDNSVLQFNKVVGSYEGKVLPGARRFTELGIASESEEEPPSTVSTTARDVTTTG
jgi:DNA recombination protein RmuC